MGPFVCVIGASLSRKSGWECKEKWQEFSTSERCNPETPKGLPASWLPIARSLMGIKRTTQRRFRTVFAVFQDVLVLSSTPQLGTFKVEKRHLSTRKSRPFRLSRLHTVRCYPSSLLCNNGLRLHTKNRVKTRETASGHDFLTLRALFCQDFWYLSQPS